MKKCNRSWPFLLLIFFNLLCAAAVILLCVRVNIETEDIKKQTAQAEKDYASLEIKLTELDKKPKEKQMKVAEEAEETDLKEENDKKGGQKEEQKNTPVQEEEENDRQQEPYGDANGRKVAIDPGHQGSWVDMSAQEPNGPGSSEMKARCSTGTQGTYSGISEYNLNLDVSLKLQKVLENRGYSVIMTRTDNDSAISNAERAQLAYNEGADIFVRIHANGDDTHTASGALTMGPSPDNPYVGHLYDQCQRLSQYILDSYCENTGFINRGVQHTDSMTGINWSQIPVTIVEMGFMTSEHDDLKMADDEFQQVMAEGIANGIDHYFTGE